MKANAETVPAGENAGASERSDLEVTPRGEGLKNLPAELDGFFAGLNEHDVDDLDVGILFDDDEKLRTLTEQSQEDEGAALRGELLQAFVRFSGEDATPEVEQMLVDELGPALLMRSLKLEQQQELQGHVDETCDFLVGIGLQLPLKPVRENLGAVRDGGYGMRQELLARGVIDEEFEKAMQKQALDTYFRDKEMPAVLAEMSEDLQQYWGEESERIGDDALIVFLHKAGEEYLDENGRPTKEAFGPDSPLLVYGAFAHYDTMSHYSGRTSDWALAEGKSALRLVQEHIDDVSDAADKLLVQASLKVDLDNKDEFIEFSNLANTCHHDFGERYFGMNRKPTETFWQEMYFSGVPAMEQLCLERPEANYTEAQKAYLGLEKSAKENLSYYLRWAKPSRGKFENLDATLNADGTLQEEFYEEGVLGCGPMEKVALDFPEQLAGHFGKTELAYLQMPEKYRNVVREQYGTRIDKGFASLARYDIAEAMTKYFDDEGAKPELFQELFGKGQYKLLLDETVSVKDMGLSEVQEYFLDKYSQIDDKSIAAALDRGVQDLNFAELTFEQVDRVMNIVGRIQTSNAIELRRSGGNFLEAVVQSDDYEMKLDRVEEVFLHNNLPYAAKTFKTFQILHPADQDFGGNLHNATKRGALAEMPDQGIRSREAVLFTDLMKASIDSNSRSMRSWIKKMREGNEAYLNAAYRQTQAGQENPEGKFAVTARYSEADRAVRSFGYLLGLKSLDDLEERMDRKVAEADQKGRERYTKNDFRIEKGDLVKAINSEYIGNMLQNGVICKEFLNGEAASDATPLDADLTRIEEDVDGSISAGIEWKNRHAAFGAMRVNLVMKGDERFVTEEEETTYEPEKFGLWNNNSSDCGIRVGFPSSAIDFITLDTEKTLANDKGSLFQEIAKNGFYIPVVDQKSGECIFSPEEFDELRRKLSGLEFYGAGEYQFAEDSDLADEEIGELAKGLIEYGEQVEAQRAAVSAELGRILAENYEGFRGLKTEVDGDLTPGFFELIDTGSTGRGTSVPGSKIDFDFIMRVDGPVFNDAERKEELERLLQDNLQAGSGGTTMNGLRLKDVVIPGLEEPVHIDISMVQRTNRMEFATDQAVKERLAAMFAQEPARAQLAIANIVKAKEVLKSVGAYKPKHSGETNDPEQKGGLGGVGVENWLLQNGGSLKAAARNFLEAADAAGGDFEKFQETYMIWDAGQNHFAIRDNEQSAENVGGSFSYENPYDNFVIRNMDAGGFGRMVTALREYLVGVEN